MARRTTGFLRSVRRTGGGDGYPFDIPAVAALDEIELDPSVTFLVGDNGSGKSTLLEAIAVAAGLNAEGGGRNFRFQTRGSHSELWRSLVLSKGAVPRTDYFLRAESFYNVASEVERLGVDEYYGGSLHGQSHGESFLSVLLTRFTADGLYLLDEPESALSPQGQLAMLRRVHDLVEDGAQFLVATHSPLLLAFPGALLLALDDGGITSTAYDDLAHVQLHRSFLDDPERFFHHLFAD